MHVAALGMPSSARVARSGRMRPHACEWLCVCVFVCRALVSLVVCHRRGLQLGSLQLLPPFKKLAVCWCVCVHTYGTRTFAEFA